MGTAASVVRYDLVAHVSITHAVDLRYSRGSAGEENDINVPSHLGPKQNPGTRFRFLLAISELTGVLIVQS